MLAWLKRLFSAPPPPPPRFIELWNRVNDVEQSIAWLEDSLKQTNARITNKLRKQPEGEAEIGVSDGESPGSRQSAEARPRPVGPQTAHLSRRFRGG